MAKWIKFKVTEREYQYLLYKKKHMGYRRFTWKEFILTKLRK